MSSDAGLSAALKRRASAEVRVKIAKARARKFRERGTPSDSRVADRMLREAKAELVAATEAARAALKGGTPC